MSKEKIYEIFEEISEKIPVKYQEEKIIFNTDMLPKLDDKVLVTDRITITKGTHHSNSYFKVDHLHFSTNKEYYKLLGLLLIQTVLNSWFWRSITWEC